MDENRVAITRFDTCMGIRENYYNLLMLAHLECAVWLFGVTKKKGIQTVSPWPYI